MNNRKQSSTSEPRSLNCGLSIPQNHDGSGEGATADAAEEPQSDVQKSRQTVQCAECGVISTLPELFRRGTTTGQKRGPLCPRCYDRRLAIYANWLFDPMCFFWGIGALLILCGFAPLGTVLIYLGFWCFFTFALTPFHEAAHALMALLLGLPVYEISIGWRGKALLRFEWGRCTIEVTRSPHGGMTVVAARSPRLIRLRQWLCIAAAPGLHAALAIAAGLIVLDNDSSQWLPWWVTWLIVTFGMANIYELFLSLWPRRVHSPIGEISNDGHLLWKILFENQQEIDAYCRAYYFYECQVKARHRDFAEAEACCHEGLVQFPDDLSLKWCLAAVCFDQGRYEEAARSYEDLRRHSDVTIETETLLLASIASADMATGDPGKVNRADDYSRRAFAAHPWRSDVQGIRGTVLVTAGETEQGMALIRQALSDERDRSNKAWLTATLALGTAKLGDHATARDLLQEAEKLDPDGRQVVRLRGEVERLAS